MAVICSTKLIYRPCKQNIGAQDVVENGRTLELSEKKYACLNNSFCTCLEAIFNYIFFSATTLFGVAETTKRNRESITEE